MYDRSCITQSTHDKYFKEMKKHKLYFDQFIFISYDGFIIHTFEIYSSWFD